MTLIENTHKNKKCKSPSIEKCASEPFISKTNGIQVQECKLYRKENSEIVSIVKAGEFEISMDLSIDLSEKNTAIFYICLESLEDVSVSTGKSELRSLRWVIPPVNQLEIKDGCTMPECSYVSLGGTSLIVLSFSGTGTFKKTYTLRVCPSAFRALETFYRISAYQYAEASPNNEKPLASIPFFMVLENDVKSKKQKQDTVVRYFNMMPEDDNTVLYRHISDAMEALPQCWSDSVDIERYIASGAVPLWVNNPYNPSENIGVLTSCTKKQEPDMKEPQCEEPAKKKRGTKRSREENVFRVPGLDIDIPFEWQVPSDMKNNHKGAVLLNYCDMMRKVENCIESMESSERKKKKRRRSTETHHTPNALSVN